MGSANWLRTYTLKCGVMGQMGFEIGNLKSASDNPLHVAFNIEKADGTASNTAKVQIWNLSDENLKILEGKDCIVELKAGYDNNNALILVGNVTTHETTADNADRLTELSVVDGRVELRDTYISVSYNGQTNPKDIYDYIALQMGTTILYGEDILWTMLIPNGFSFVGKARDALNKLASVCGHNWTMQNQILQVTMPGSPISTNAYVLNKTTGLISIPKRVSLSDSSKKKNKDETDATTNSTQMGYEVTFFLNGAIGVNDIVKIESDKVTGFFRIKKLTIEGDNYEGDWVCNAQVIQIV